jgi:hypothetical protein
VMRGRENFDGLMRFLENNAIVNYSSDLWSWFNSLYCLFTLILMDDKKTKKHI